MLNQLRILLSKLGGVAGYQNLLNVCESQNPKSQEGIAAVQNILNTANLSHSQRVECENFLNNFSSKPLTEDFKSASFDLKPTLNIKEKGNNPNDGLILS